tara:strand:- start:64 stop:588 length:525 start_codon:yes stop_codon:yes gene_type:complete
MYDKIIFLILILIISCSDPTNPDQEKLKLVISSSNTSISQNNFLVIDVSIENATDLFAVSFDLMYESEFLSADSVSFNQIDGIFGTDVFTYHNLTNNDTISISAGLTQTATKDSVSGNGSICQLYFTTMKTGTTNIDILKDVNNNYELKMINENGDNTIGYDELVITNASIIIE